MIVTALICGLLFVLTFLLWRHYSGEEYLSVKHKTVLITGCDSGIGLQLACHLAEKGFAVIATCLRPSSLEHEIFQQFRNILPIVMDVTNDESICQAKKILEGSSRTELWGLINNAGVLIYGEFDWLTHSHCQKQILVNVEGNFKVTKHFLPYLKSAKGRILNISSVNGGCAFPGTAVYSGTKFAIEGFSAALRHELKKFGMKVIIIRPGDYVKLTNIMAQHEQHQQEMWTGMSEEDKQCYGQYFDKFHQLVAEYSGMSSPTTFQGTTLLRDVEHALLATKPKIRYTSAPLLYRIFYTSMKYLPDSLQDSWFYFLYNTLFRLSLEPQTE